MCLFSSQKEAILSDSDIYCYKVLISVKDGLTTPYRDFHFKIGVLTEDIAFEHIEYLFGYTLIESGYFHSYTDLDVAKCAVADIIRKCKIKLNKKVDCKIFKAIIPKDTKIFVGHKDICSKSLKIIEECFD